MRLLLDNGEATGPCREKLLRQSSNKKRANSCQLLELSSCKLSCSRDKTVMEKRDYVGTETSHGVSGKIHVHPQSLEWVEHDSAAGGKPCYNTILGSVRLQLKPLRPEKVKNTGLTKVLLRM